VSGWVLQALDALPAEMAAAEQRSKKYERAIVDLVEVFLLRDRVGERFTGTVVDVERDHRRGVVMIAEPAVAARVNGEHLRLGHEVSVRLASADFAAGAVTFELDP
jgi:exoribonuclease R